MCKPAVREIVMTQTVGNLLNQLVSSISHHCEICCATFCQYVFFLTMLRQTLCRQDPDARYDPRWLWHCSILPQVRSKRSRNMNFWAWAVSNFQTGMEELGRTSGLDCLWKIICQFPFFGWDSSLFSVQKNDILPSTLCKIVTGCTL